jgi:hypothetical protein
MSSMSGGQKTDSVNNGNLRTEYGNNRMIVNDGTDDILLAGQDNDGDIVFKVAQPGFDVKTASDDELAFSSQFNTLKIFQTGVTQISKSANSSGATSVIAHNLGYRPIVFAFTDTQNALFGAGNMLPVVNYNKLIGATAGACAELTNAALVYGVGLNDVTFSFDTPSWGAAWPATAYHSAYTANIKYYIMVDTTT